MSHRTRLCFSEVVLCCFGCWSAGAAWFGASFENGGLCPSARGSSMAGRISGAGGRLPIRHGGVGGFTWLNKFIHLFRTGGYRLHTPGRWSLVPP